jgi:hypothetical protein
MVQPAARRCKCILCATSIRSYLIRKARRSVKPRSSCLRKTTLLYATINGSTTAKVFSPFCRRIMKLFFRVPLQRRLTHIPLQTHCWVVLSLRQNIIKSIRTNSANASMKVVKRSLLAKCTIYIIHAPPSFTSRVCPLTTVRAILRTRCAMVVERDRRK